MNISSKVKHFFKNLSEEMYIFIYECVTLKCFTIDEAFRVTLTASPLYWSGIFP